METSIIISLIALALSGITAWLTWWHRGSIKMTQPTQVYFGPDVSCKSKVYLRTLLYSTSRRGQWLESMFVTLSRGSDRQQFNVWVYGERDALVRGSGLFVGYEGIATNHNFLLPKSSPEYHFAAGTYLVEVYAKLVNKTEPVCLWKRNLTVDEGEEIVMVDGQGGLYFDWDPAASDYHHSLDIRHAGSKIEKAMGLQRWDA